ncbi:MAG: hypothetical protein Q4C67_07995, partial [Deinococcus sp.]|nr:hypothetical protein [Deinococcus sp.]
SSRGKRACRDAGNAGPGVAARAGLRQPGGEDKDIYTGAEGFPAYWFCRSETGELLENWPSEHGVKEAVAERYGL